MKQILFIAGFKGVGKTTAARQLSKALGIDWMDTDLLLQNRYKSSPYLLFTREGEDSFRKKEAVVLENLSTQEPLIVALGGGTLMHPISLDYVKNKGFILGITCPYETLEKELLSQKPLPAFLDVKAPKESLEKHYAARMKLFKQLQIPFFDRDALQPMEEYVRKYIWQNF